MIRKVKAYTGQILRSLNEISGTDNVALVRHGFWGVFPTLTGTLTSLGLTVVYANFLPRETLGTFKFILALASSLTFLTLTGMNNAVIQAVARGARGSLSASVRLQLRWNLLYVAAGIAVAGYYLFQGNGVLAICIAILAVTLPLTQALNTFGAYLSGRKDFRAVAIFSSSSNLIYGLAIVGTLMFSYDVIPLITTHALGTLLPVACSYILVAQRDKHAITSEERQSLVRFSKHLSLINVFATISKNIDRIALFHFGGPALVATYSIANAVPQRASGILAAAFPSVMPTLAQRAPEMIRATFYRRIGQGIIVGAVATAAYWLSAPFLISMATPMYVDSTSYSRWLSLILLLVIPYLYVGGALVGQRYVRALYIQSWASHLFRIIAYPIAAMLYGLWGLIVSVLALQAFGLLTGIAVWEFETRRLAARTPPDTA
jgi:O-antigen/teichoic acid export membrane protein